MAEKIAPLSQTQLGIYVDCLRLEGNAYNVNTLLELDAEVDMNRLAAATEKAVAAHRGLHVRIFEHEGEICQKIVQEEYKQDIWRLSESVWREKLAEINSEPFQLHGGRLFQFILAETECGKYWLFKVHHICADASAMQIFATNVSKAYLGEELELEVYDALDVANDEKSARESEKFQQATAWYEKNFGGLEVEGLPQPDSADKDNFAKMEKILPIPYEKVVAFCRQNGVSEAALASGAFALLNGIYNNQQEALFSTIYNGRGVKTQNNVSMLVKTLPVYCKWTSETKVKDFLREIRMQAKMTRKHDIYSFMDLNKICPMSNKAFFAYHGAIRLRSEFCGKPCIEKSNLNDLGINPLKIELFADDNGMRLTIEHSRMYSDAFADTFAECYGNVLLQLMSKEFIREIKPLNAAQIKNLDAFNDTAVDYDKNQTVVSLFNSAAEKFADNTAVIFSDKKISYRELDALSNDIAAYILSKNISGVASILIPRCEYMPITALGALKAGCAYQPLDSTYPPERLNFMVKDADAKILITTKELRPLITNFDGEVLLVDEVPHAENFELPTIKPEDLFILLYTSGSTGVPKGVKLTHKNLVCFVNWYKRFYSLTDKDCVGAYASFGFDANMMDTYPALTSGATLCIVPEEMRLDLEGMNKYFEANDVTHAFMTTQVCRQFATDIDNHSLKYLSAGGEKLVTLNPPTNYSFINGYGPTECTIFSTTFKVERAEENIPIGKPLDNVKLYVVDQNFNRVPIGALGELIISGIQVGAGYLNRPEKTAEVFIENPFDGGEYSRAYRTGDVVRYRADGNIEFIGRRDGQVKIRGFRVELSEVEAVIREFDGIKDVTVAAFDAPGGGKFIAAYVVSDSAVNVDALNKFISERKPPYMVPAFTMQIDKIPLNQNGKVNRRVLPKPEMKSEEAYTQPENDRQQKIFDCVAEVLGHKNFGIDTDLFSIGLSSIGVIRLSPVLAKAFNVSVSIRDLRDNPTAVGLEKILSATSARETYKLQVDYPLTQTQIGILVETLAHPDTVIYNIPLLLKLSTDWDLQRLKSAIETAIKAHPYFNATIFTNAAGNFRVKRDDSAVPEVEIIEIPNLPEKLVKPFELIGGKLYRAKIFKTDAGNYLFFECHHIIFDGTSSTIFLEDVNAAYAGQPVEKENFTGFELALEEEKLRGTEQYAKAKAYYEKLLVDVDRDNLPAADVAGEKETSDRFSFDSRLDIGAIRTFCAKNKLTENALFNAAFAFVLSKYNYKDKSLYATIYNGRNDSRLTRAVTMLVKTFPVAVTINGKQKIREFVSAVGEQLVDSMSNDIYSFAEIAHDYEISADILFVYQGDNFSLDKIGGRKAELCPLYLDEAKACIQIETFIRDEKISFRCEYRSDRYSKAFLKGVVSCLEQVAAEFITKERLADVNILSSEEEATLDAFNDTAVDYDKTQTVVSLFNSAAETFSDNTAVIFGDKKISYRELDALSNDVAAYILSKNISAGNVVSILIPRCEYMPITALGALKAGCAYQPLDSTYPPERLNFMVKDADAKILITTKELRPLITEFDGEVLFIDSIPHVEEKINPPTVNPDDLFILLYTSGSTGVPKGVKLTHKNFVCFVNWYKRFYNLSDKNCVSAYASFGFDANMMETYPALTSGATLCIIPEEMRLDLNAINAYFEANGVTHGFMTTQVGRQFATDVDNHSLKYMMTGGEKLATLNPPTRYGLFNMYGPTECTIALTAFKVERAEENIPIGKALDNMKLYVVDQSGKRVPVGACGELWAAGLQVGAGYLNRPEKTAEVFINNPFEGGEYSRVYRTGDVVRYRQDGNIEFIGRRDGQVKIRGFRIELSEVEAVIREFDAIKDVTVAAFDAPSGGKFIAAYVVSDSAVNVDELNKFIAERKPPYMVPAFTIQIDKIPLNQNGKVNRRALPKPESKSAGEKKAAPRKPNILEKELVEIVSGIIGTTEIDFESELAYLGLTSISAIKLSTQLYKKFGVNIPVKELFISTLETIEDKVLTDLLAGQKVEQRVSATVTISKISGTQRGIYLECMKNPLSTAYNTPLIYNFEANTDTDKLADAVKKIFAAHPSINVHFELRDEGVMMIRDDELALEIPIHTLSEENFADFKANFVKPFKLDMAPLYRLAIVKTSERVSLFADFHHLIFDGMSMNLFMSNLKTLLEGGELELEGASYFEFVHEEEKNLDENKKYFSELLKDFETASEIPSDVRGKVDGEIKIFDCEISSDVKTFCKERRLPPPSVYPAVLSYVIARYSASRKVYFTTIANGRSNIKFSDTFGMFVNTLPLAAELEDISVDEFLQKVFAMFGKAIDHENYPFSQIAADYSFVPKIMYEYQANIAEYSERMQVPHMTGIEFFEQVESKFKLIVRIVSRENKLRMMIEYNTADYSDAMIEGLAKSFNIVLEKFISAPTAPLLKVSLIDDEREKILSTFRNATDTTTIKKVYKLFQEGMEEYAQKTPDAVALIASDANFTYREFDEAANRIANALLSCGVKQGSRIALLLPRTSRALLAMFGVLKAGCAYIPCDPDYPPERINQILEDSQAQFIITTADRIKQEKPLSVEEILTNIEQFLEEPDAASFAGEKYLDVERLLLHRNSARPQIEISPDDLAYLIYTSGSTGKPKGVMLTHSGAANYFTNNPANVMVHALCNDATKFISVTTFAFDMSLKEIGTTLFNGLTLVLADETKANNPDELALLARRTAADALNATPSRFLSYLESESLVAALRGFKLVVSGGEKYSDVLLAKLKKITSARIFNTYGPTEITVSSNGKELTHSDEISIGRPLLNVTEFIVDSDGNELPPGLVGELYIGGAGVSKGYNNLPEMTAERFIEYKGKRVYKSGDYARWKNSGDVEILGRKDNQIKLRGLRIELGEVESALSKIPAIKDVVVKIVKIKGNEHLCAYFTASETININALKTELGKTLPQYMVPTAYLQLKKMPTTLNGKLDVKALPAAQIFRNVTTNKSTNRIEADFCKIFSEILELEDVGIDESFFDLGGTSLLVTRVVIMAQKAGYKINFADVFLNKTPRELAALQKIAIQTNIDAEISNFDYGKLQPILGANNLNNFKYGEREPLGNIILTGATGYLGVHILQEFLENYEGKVYCLLRDKKKLSAEKRLKIQMFYYFNKDYEELFDKRIFILEGDVTRAETLEQIKTLPNVSTVINCAALVKHFSQSNEIEVVNYGGVKNLIAVCKAQKLRLIQVSTMSTVGMGLKGEVDENISVTEQTLYFRQSLTNKYVRSKFLAEREILNAVANGLHAKIMRVGNLSARYSDGEFQMNAGTNAAMGRLKIFAILGCCPFSQMDYLMEFSPIDEVAKAILILSETPKECVLFHPINQHNISLGEVIGAMTSNGFPIKFVEQEEFLDAWQAAEENPDKANILTSMIAYRSKDTEIISFPKNNLYTMQVLYRLGYRWPFTMWDYVEKFISMLKRLDFFSLH